MPRQCQVQLRKWIRNLAALESAEPSAKCIPTSSRRPPSHYAAGPKGVAEDSYASVLWRSALATSSEVTSAAASFGYAQLQLNYPQHQAIHYGAVSRTPLEPVVHRAPQIVHNISRGPLALQHVQAAAQRAATQRAEEREFAARELLFLSNSHSGPITV